MTWLMFSIFALALGAAVLAIFERRKGRRLRMDERPDALRDPNRAAYTEAERLRAEISVAQPRHGGGIF